MFQVFILMQCFDFLHLTLNMSTGLQVNTFKLYKSDFCSNIGKFSFSNNSIIKIGIVYHSMYIQVTLLKAFWIVIISTV